MKLSIILPTFNEAGNIKKLIPEIKKDFPDAEILVVDDNSPDRTAEVAKKLGARIIVREKKEGLGAALTEGYNSASGGIFVSMDADCSIAVKDIHRLLEKLKYNDIAIGSKHSKGSSAPGFGTRKQEIISKISNKFFRWFFQLPVDDVTLNFRAMRKETWKKLQLQEKTNVFFLEMLVNAKRQRLKIAQIPINFTKRNYGESKTNIRKLGVMFSKYLLKTIFRIS